MPMVVIAAKIQRLWTKTRPTQWHGVELEEPRATTRKRCRNRFCAPTWRGRAERALPRSPRCSMGPIQAPPEPTQNSGTDVAARGHRALRWKKTLCSRPSRALPPTALPHLPVQEAPFFKIVSPVLARQAAPCLEAGWCGPSSKLLRDRPPESEQPPGAGLPGEGSPGAFRRTL